MGYPLCKDSIYVPACHGLGTWKTQPLCRGPGQVLICMQEPCLDGHLHMDPVTRMSYMPVCCAQTLSSSYMFSKSHVCLVFWNLQLSCFRAHLGTKTDT